MMTLYRLVLKMRTGVTIKDWEKSLRQKLIQLINAKDSSSPEGVDEMTSLNYLKIFWLDDIINVNF